MKLISALVAADLGMLLGALFLQQGFWSLNFEPYSV